MQLLNQLKLKLNTLLIKLGLKSAPKCRTKKTCCKKKK